MSFASRSAPRGKPLIAAFLAVAALLAASWEPVAAECNPPGADASFRKAVPLAERIVVGRVVDVGADASSALGGGSYQFTLEVEQVLRGGTTAPMLVFDHLETGGCIRWLAAARGDQIALALDVRRPDMTVASNTAAWLSGAPPIAVYETIAMAELIDLAGVRLPETSTASLGSLQKDAGLLAVSLVAAAAATLLLAARRRSCSPHLE